MKRDIEHLCQRLEKAMAKANAVLGLSPGELAKATSSAGFHHDYDRIIALRGALAKADAVLRAPDDTSARIAALELQIDRLKSLDRLQAISRPPRPPFILRTPN